MNNEIEINEKGAQVPDTTVEDQDRALAAAPESKSKDVEVDDTNSRTARSQETREADEREMPWNQARMLPTPDPRPGTDHRYVRISSGGTVDNMNHSQALRDRWEPARMEEYPELGMIRSDIGSAEGLIVLGGMMLCKRPSWMGDIIKKRISEESLQQAAGVDKAYLGEQDSTMQKFSEKRTRVEFGGHG